MPRKDLEDILVSITTNKNLFEITRTSDIRAILSTFRRKWIGYVSKKQTNNITPVALRWTPEGKSREDRLRSTWRRTVEKELKDINLTLGEVKKRAKNGNS